MPRGTQALTYECVQGRGVIQELLRQIPRANGSHASGAYWPKEGLLREHRGQRHSLQMAGCKAVGQEPVHQGGAYEGLFVRASLLHVGAWLDSAATVVHLVHDAMQADVRGQLEGVLQQMKLLDLPRLPRVDGSCYLEGPGVPLLSRTGLQEVLRGCLSFQLNEELWEETASQTRLRGREKAGWAAKMTEPKQIWETT